jgi:hypothetical protein
MDFSFNYLTDEAASSFAEALKVNTLLASLNLSSNQVTSLDLSNNLLKSRGAIAIVDALKVNSSLSC